MPMISINTRAKLPTDHGEFTLVSFEGLAADHVALVYGKLPQQNALVRIHSECLTGEVFRSRRCDCGDQLDSAMQKIVAEGAGAIIYLRQEGRGIGLMNKLRAYALQDQGMDTVEANHALGFPDDARDFTPAVDMLKCLDVQSVRILTNNPRKIRALETNDIAVMARVPLLSCVSTENAAYLKTKASKLGHLLEDTPQKTRA